MESDTSMASITCRAIAGTRTAAVGWATPNGEHRQPDQQQREREVAPPAGRRGATEASRSTLLNRATYSCAAAEHRIDTATAAMTSSSNARSA